MAGVLRQWNDREVQILVLISFMVQAFLLMFAWMRRRNISIVPRTLLWLAYLLADYIATYILGHMSFCGKSHEQQQLVAFWAPFLLVHLGGQDAFTAYSMEDNQLWPRHLLSLFVQALGVAYVLYKYINGNGTLVTAAALIFIAGILKYGERVWALKFSSLGSISKFLNDSEKPRVKMEAQLDWGGPYCPRAQWGEGESLGSEELLQGAHDLFPICMGQFVDYKFWPSRLQSKAIELFAQKGCLYELIEMQLSLMHDVLYTKAAVIHTWCGCFIRAFSLVATITTFFMFQSSIGKNDFNRVDAIVTYILIAGAFVLEMIALLGAIGSTWTCALLRARRCDRLHSISLSVRRCVKAAERNRRWSGSIGQYKMLHLHNVGWRDSQGQFHTRRIATHPPLSSTVISRGTKELVLEEIRRMVDACKGKEEIMRNYSGQCVLNQSHGLFEDPTWSTGIDFDDKILAWHYATDMFIYLSVQAKQESAMEPLVKAIEDLSGYMVFLLVKRPYMLPSPIRPGLYANAKLGFKLISRSTLPNIAQHIKTAQQHFGVPAAFDHGVVLAGRMLNMEDERDTREVLQLVLGVWVEMLCYAAHHCSRDSHARQLNSGGEFITVVWLLTTTMFNYSYCDESGFRECVRKSFIFDSKPGFLKRLCCGCMDLLIMCATLQPVSELVED